ncbi:unnamed protein product [Haemonchus placei]|uniref:Alternative protein n=1 Tax=Haemonchus placei TaxID=6290 RepID=A0A0N4WLE9_HAEPC|nr:unnamed protein product [Haemonchus placei]
MLLTTSSLMSISQKHSLSPETNSAHSSGMTALNLPALRVSGLTASGGRWRATSKSLLSPL